MLGVPLMNAYGIISLGRSSKGERKMRPFEEKAFPPSLLLSGLGIAFTLLAILGCMCVSMVPGAPRGKSTTNTALLGC